MRRSALATMGAALVLTGALGWSPAAADEVEFVNPAASCREGPDVGRLFGTCVGGLASSTKPGKARHDT